MTLGKGSFQTRLITGNRMVCEFQYKKVGKTATTLIIQKCGMGLIFPQIHEQHAEKFLSSS